MQAQQQQARLGRLPTTPAHSFIGRSRELLMLERLLEQQPYAVIRGPGGIGKTTLAVELARWLVRSHRFDRCAFVSLEEYSHDRAVLDELGQQLCGSHYAVAPYGDDLDQALQPLQRVLENDTCLLLLDNLESLLANEQAVQPVLALLERLVAPAGVGCGEARTASCATDAVHASPHPTPARQQHPAAVDHPRANAGAV